VRLLALNKCKAGLELAKTIDDANGNVLLAEGYKLTDTIISRMQRSGLFAIYVKDAYSSGLIEDKGIPFELKQKALKELKQSFSSLHKGGELNARISQEHLKGFKNIIDTVLQELTSNPRALSLVTSLQVYDNYVYNHSFNVMTYALQLGLAVGLNQKYLELLGIGALLHDVGKMIIPIEILNKPGKLTPEEFELVKTHTTEGFEYLRKHHTISLIASHLAFQHHEKLDGSGYPRGLKGVEIHPLAKILAVADVFDAVTSSRSYRTAILPHKGLEILYAGTGTHFDKNLVELFRRAVVLYPVGVTVILQTGEVCIVVDNNAGYPERPIVRIIEREGRPLDMSEVYELDLSKELTAEIVHCDAFM
jgi:putative nucleotidyltransferase with HDIG domain